MKTRIVYILFFFLLHIYNVYGQVVDSTHVIDSLSFSDSNYIDRSYLLDSSGKEVENLLTKNVNDRYMNSGPVFEFGVGKSEKVNINWGNYYFEKESYKKAIERFEGIENKSLDVMRKLGKCYLSTKNMDSSEYFFKWVSDTSENPIDHYNYSHVLYINGKFEEAENVRKKYADYSDEMRADLFKDHPLHKSIFSTVSEIDLHNLFINTKNSDFGAYAVKNDTNDSYSVLYTSADEYSLKNIKRRKYIRPDEPTYDIFRTDFEFPSMKFKQPVPFSGELKNQFQEGPAIMTNDQNTIYFTRSTSVESNDEALYLNIFKVTQGNINTPDSVLGLSINNDHYSVMHPTITDDGNRMYFSSDMPGGYGGMDVYYCEIYGLYKQFFLTDTTATRELIRLSRPVNLGGKINTEGNEVFPFHMDDKTLFFASDGRIGFGGLDIYMVNDYLDTNHTEVKNMGIPFNSSKDDFSFFMSEDLKFGFISSNREGGVGDDDIYCFKTNLEIADGVDDYYTMVMGEVLEVLNNTVLENDFLNDTIDDFLNKNLYHKAILNTQPKQGTVVFNEDGTFIYTPNHNQVKEDYFTYRIMHDRFYHDSINVYLSAIEKTVPIAVDDQYIMKKGTDLVINNIEGTLHNDSDPGGDSLSAILVEQGLYGKVTLKGDGSFIYTPDNIEVTHDTFYYAITDGFFYDTAEVTLSRLEKGIDIATVIEIKPIYFDLNKSDIRSDAALELDKIVQVMNDYPSMVVELGSHTDCRASYSYNRALSDRRAKSSATYIKARITNPERIFGKGYGESKLINKCECEGRRAVPCTDEEHQENRRTEFLILKMD